MQIREPETPLDFFKLIDFLHDFVSSDRSPTFVTHAQFKYVMVNFQNVTSGKAPNTTLKAHINDYINKPWRYSSDESLAWCRLVYPACDIQIYPLGYGWMCTIHAHNGFHGQAETAGKAIIRAIMISLKHAYSLDFAQSKLSIEYERRNGVNK